MNKNIKKVLVTIAKKNVFAREVMYKVKLSRDKSRYMKFYKSEKVDNKLCVFEAFNGRKYCDSPKAIYLEMLNDKKYKDCKECHIEPDWVLIYRIKDAELILLLFGTGSHSELFKK